MTVSRLALAALLLLSACGDDATTPAAPQPDDPYVPTSAAPPAATPVATPAPAAPSRLPARITVSTNEPFWNAAVEGDRVVLTGADSPRRELRIVSDTPGDARRRIEARDARGRIVVEIVDRASINDMSGLPFPHSGSLTIGQQGPFAGCAAPTPAPADAAVMPADYIGLWAADADGCRLPPTSIAWVRIDPRSLRYHESSAALRAVRQRGDAVEAELDFEGEGQRWRSTKTLRLVGTGDILEIAERGMPTIRRMRCKPVDTAPAAADGETSPAAARDVVMGYYQAIERRDYAAAYAHWSDGGKASGQSPAQFAESFAKTASMKVAIDAPGPVEGAAGSLYVEVPVRVEARLADGSVQHFAGSYALRRVNDVPGSTAEQRRWHIARASLQPVGK